MKRTIEAIIFDLDGVIVSTDEYHYKAWKRLADEEGIFFDRNINHRLRGVSRMACMEIILEKASKTYTAEEKEVMAERKNRYYIESLKELDEQAMLPGVKETLPLLKEEGYRIAIASSSKNAGLILEKLGLSQTFHSVIDGNHITRSKPDPEVFLKAEEALEAEPRNCIVVEDSTAGIDAAICGGMIAVGIGGARGYEKTQIGITSFEQIAGVCRALGE